MICLLRWRWSTAIQLCLKHSAEPLQVKETSYNRFGAGSTQGDLNWRSSSLRSVPESKTPPHTKPKDGRSHEPMGLREESPRKSYTWSTITLLLPLLWQVRSTSDCSLWYYSGCAPRWWELRLAIGLGTTHGLSSTLGIHAYQSHSPLLQTLPCCSFMLQEMVGLSTWAPFQRDLPPAHLPETEDPFHVRGFIPKRPLTKRRPLPDFFSSFAKYDNSCCIRLLWPLHKTVLRVFQQSAG